MRKLVRRVKRELKLYRLLLRDRETPKLSKLFIALALIYALSPIDLIPDFIPVLGFLDDFIIIPGLIILALKLTPKELIQECRLRAEAA